MKKKELTGEEIDDIIITEADNLTEWEKPTLGKRRGFKHNSQNKTKEVSKYERKENLDDCW